MMKRYTITTLAGVAIALISYGIGLHAAHRAQPPSLANLQDASWLKQQLGLNASQETALREVEKEYNAQLIALCEAHCAARNELATHLLRADWNATVEKERLTEMGRAQIQTDALTLEHVRRVSRVLTPAQRARYQQYVSERMQTACPHQLHHGALAHSGEAH